MKSSDDSVHGSDIKALLRDELQSLNQQVERAINRSSDRLTIIHLRDIQTRIEEILDPS
jgi:CRISPR/Cas system-associated endoribonuclease Cas2